MDIREIGHMGIWWTGIEGFEATSKDDSIFEGTAVKVKFAVCSTCRGRGSHVNPSIDSHGITTDEMDELGEDFFRDYREGVYDIVCRSCEGQRVVPVPEDPAQLLLLLDRADELEELVAEREAEVRMGY